ncbi:MAG: ABC-2 family transporter protein [Halanaerobiales bacterium]|nr:ABC-2 family transporter protein [Halanaerobiales bacterium]
MIKKYFKLYSLYLSQYFKTRLNYRKDFLISLFMEMLSKISTLLFITIIFSHIPNLQGWNIHQVLIIYGLALTCRGFYFTFFGRLEDLGSEFIIEGNLDRLMVRPVNPLFLLIADRIYENQLTEVLLGIVAIIVGLVNVKITITFGVILTLCFSIVNGVLLYFGFFLLINSISFWFHNRFSLMWTFMELSDFVQYPVTVFNPTLRFILTWIIPFALTSYFPAILILDQFKSYHWIAYTSPIITLIFLMLGYKVWSSGLYRYESTGS